MFAGTAVKLGRATVACTVAAAMTISGPARAGEPAEGEAAAGPPSEELNSQAEKHAVKAVEHFNNGAYVDAEEEFRRVAFFAPNWRPLHFNLGVLAEAQGKLGTAVTEYKSFRPYGSPEEQLIVDQRIDELGRRKVKIAKAYKRQIALGAGAVTLGVAGMGGAAALFVLMAQRQNKADEWNSKADMLQAQYDTMYNMDPATADPTLQDQANTYRSEATDLTKSKSGLLYGGIYLALFGLLLAAYSIIPLRNSIRSKRQLDGLAFGKTRLKWNGGAGVQLHF